MAASPTWRVLDSSEALIAFAADEIARLQPKSFGLSGGRTPKALYRTLASRPGIDWKSTDFFWSDERCVSPKHPDSNYGMAIRAFLAPIGALPERLHRIEGELGAKKASPRYEETLRRLAPDGLDLLLLGVGTDGHAASLFPNSPALKETRLWAAPSKSPAGQDRVTLTFPYIAMARRILILVEGKSKAAIAAEALTNPDASLPIQAVRAAGPILWLLDRAAAAGL